MPVDFGLRRTHGDDSCDEDSDSTLNRSGDLALLGAGNLQYHDLKMDFDGQEFSSMKDNLCDGQEYSSMKDNLCDGQEYSSLPTSLQRG
eukprot:1587707-Rhodomonas_salina.1